MQQLPGVNVLIAALYARAGMPHQRRYPEARHTPMPR